MKDALTLRIQKAMPEDHRREYKVPVLTSLLPLWWYRSQQDPHPCSCIAFPMLEMSVSRLAFER